MVLRCAPQKRLSYGVCLNVTHVNCILTVFESLAAIFIIFFNIMAKYSKEVLVLIIFYPFPHANTNSRRNWMQWVVVVAACMFPWTSVTVNHTRYKLWNWSLVGFEIAAYCRTLELELYFFNKWLIEKCTCFTCETFEIYIHYKLSVK